MNLQSRTCVGYSSGCKGGNQGGFSLIELMVIISLVGIMSAIAVSNMKIINKPVVTSCASTSHLIRLARSRAVSTTQAITIKPVSATELRGFRSATCGGTLAAVTDLRLTLSAGSWLIAPSWSICFDTRGFAENNVQFEISDGVSPKLVKVALGGGTQVD